MIKFNDLSVLKIFILRERYVYEIYVWIQRFLIQIPNLDKEN